MSDVMDVGRVLLAAVLAAAIGAASCTNQGGDTQDAARSDSEDQATAVGACALLDESEVTDLVGGEVDRRASGIPPYLLDGMEYCAFDLAEGGSVIMGVLFEGGEAALASYRERRDGLAAVADVGDEAVWHPGGRTLYARRGDALVGVNPSPGTVRQEGAGQDVAAAVAERALESLP